VTAIIATKASVLRTTEPLITTTHTYSESTSLNIELLLDDFNDHCKAPSCYCMEAINTEDNLARSEEQPLGNR
jgi:hypothetical protein